ncbi:DUF4386 domain-containing protein [Paenibacillus sp. PL2-23]|uniref:DUF4386 domain-containing protein n=1 Tax=Paenibacillus sp. PL2-23 TaxID=2100729 RepID=UPI0030FA4C5C
MDRDRMNGILLGLLYIVAAAASIIAVVLYEPLLSEQWYRTAIQEGDTKVLIGIGHEMLLVLSAVGTAVMLFPYVRRWNEHLALGYLCFRLLEAVFIAIGVVSLFGLLQLSFYYEANGPGVEEQLRAAGVLLQGFHQWTAMLGPNFMLGVNTLLYSYLLLRTGLVPRPLAIFGMLTAVMVFVAGMLEMFGVMEPMSAAKGLIALPVGVYELSLAVWLIVRGFARK